MPSRSSTGKIDPNFQTDAIAGSLDGEFYRQDKLTVLAGKLPLASSTDELILTPRMAAAFHLTVGDRMTWQFYKVNCREQTNPAAPDHVRRWRRSPTCRPPWSMTSTPSMAAILPPAADRPVS